MPIDTDAFLEPLLDDSGKVDPQKVVDKALSFGTGSWEGPDWQTSLAGNGYAQSMIPGALAGAGVGALINALRGKSILSGAGIGLGLGAGLGAAHQYLYDTNKEYAFNNPFTQFAEWMTVPKDAEGIVNAYDLIKGFTKPKEEDDSLTAAAKSFINTNPMIRGINFNYNDLRNYAMQANGDIVKDLEAAYPFIPTDLAFNTYGLRKPSIDASKLRPHHLYYPLYFAHRYAK